MFKIPGAGEVTAREYYFAQHVRYASWASDCSLASRNSTGKATADHNRRMARFWAERARYALECYR